MAELIVAEEHPGTCLKCGHGCFGISPNGRLADCAQCGQVYLATLVSLYDDRTCPDCGLILRDGPRGGAGMNILCDNGHRFLISISSMWRFAKRISPKPDGQ